MERRRLWVMWWAGFLATIAFVHLVRLLLGVSVTIGALQVPLWWSGVAVPVAGSLSLWLVRRARGVGD